MDTIKFKYLTKAERDSLPDSDFGYINGNRRLFPIVTENDVVAAAKLIGRAKGLSDKEREAVKKKIIKIAKAKKFDIPESWQVDMSDLTQQLAENILFSAELGEQFEVEIDDRLLTLKVTNIRKL